MTASPFPLSLRRLLLVDAATCAAMGLLLTLGAAPVAELTALPAGLLLYVGIALFPCAAFMALAALPQTVNPLAAWVVVLGNVGWVVGSAGILVAGWVAPNALGVVFVVIQALAVAVLAKLEHGALRGGPLPAQA